MASRATSLPRTAPACLAGLALLCLPAAARAQVETDLSAAEVDALLAQVADPTDMGLRAAALDQLCEAQAGALPVLTERLFRPNGITAGLQQRLLEDYVRRLPAELPAESPVPRRTALAPLLHVLILAPHEAYRESWAAVLQAAALLAALDVIDSNEALMEVIRFVGQYEGAYARAAGLVVRAKGGRGIPALVLSRRVPDGKVKGFVATQLARMGKDRAPLMAQTDDDQLLADILRAVAEVKDPEGVNVMLSFVNSDRPFVRRAARESLLRYERNAIWAVRKSYEDLTGERADTSWGWRETMDRLFAAQDAARLEPLDVLLAQGLAAARDERFSEMDEAFGAILGREPEYPRRAEMIPGLLAYGERLLADGEVLEARRILRLTGYLVPEDDVRAARVRAHLAYLEGLRRRDLGFPDPTPFREAAALDPTYERLIASREDLARLVGEAPVAAPPAASSAASSDREGPGSVGPDGVRGRPSSARFLAAGGILLAAFAGLVLLLSLRRVPGRLFGRPAAVAGGVPEARAVDPGDVPGAGGLAPGGLALPYGAGGSGPDVPSPAPVRSPTVEVTAAPLRSAGEGGDEGPQGPRSPPAPPSPAGRPVEAVAEVPVPEDPYRRIELALSRLRKDAASLAEPPAAPAGPGGESRSVDRRKDGERHD
ncbi:MAG: hypothetical protein JXB32_25590 [Deltaproteobacteria bacterium]|nr:hypothetical protein [Deltaproteobacteria bacterium]